jgi:hypothetical protein
MFEALCDEFMEKGGYHSHTNNALYWVFASDCFRISSSIRAICDIVWHRMDVMTCKRMTYGRNFMIQKRVIDNLFNSFQARLAICAQLEGVCLNRCWMEIQQEHHRRLSRNISVQNGDHMGGDDPSEDTVIDVSGDDENEESHQEIEEMGEVIVKAFDGIFGLLAQ